MYRLRSEQGTFSWLFERFASLLFSHRQVYMRNRGSVFFYEFAPSFQLVFLVVMLLSSAWVVYASVATIYARQMLEAKDARIVGQEKLLSNNRVQTRLLVTALLEECKRVSCDIPSVIAKSPHPVQTQSLLSQYGAAPKPKLFPVPNKRETSFNPFVWSWEAIHYVLSELVNLATDGRRKEVSDETVLGSLVGAIWSLLAFVWFCCSRVLAKRLRATNTPSQYGF